LLVQSSYDLDMDDLPTATSSPKRLEARELRAWRGFLNAHATLLRALDAELEAAHGLPVSSYEVLMNVADAEGERMRMHDIASRVLLSRSGLTRLVDRLEKSGYVRRESCPDDARGAFAVLTPAGRVAVDAARATHLAGVRERFLRHFSEEEQEQLGAFWERLLPA
jgi:DNA-binding MarR family transcriptional regulator